MHGNSISGLIFINGYNFACELLERYCVLSITMILYVINNYETFIPKFYLWWLKLQLLLVKAVVTGGKSCGYLWLKLWLKLWSAVVKGVVTGG